MANAFFKRGAGLYLGYNQECGTGHIAGNGFLTGLLNGKSSYASFLSIPQRYRNYTFYSDAQRKNVHPILRYKLNPKYRNDICLTHPVTFDVTLSAESSTYTLEGGIKTYMPLCNFYSNNSCNDEIEKNTYGFLISNSPEMTNAEQINIDLSSDDVSYNNQDCFLSWKATIDKIGNQDLQLNTTYYYRAYMNDGYSDCYGEIKQFTTGSNIEDTNNYEAYVAINGNTLTFYYDSMRLSRKGIACNKSGKISVESFRERGYCKKVEKVIFNKSFTNYLPIKFSFSGCTELISIVDIIYLNTSNIDDMSYMFGNCQSLTNIDLCSFNTDKVKTMNWMFSDCHMLSELDLSSFNTSNVKDMGGMFRQCFSLKSLNLNSFNTENVESMYGMFATCKALTSLDLRSFNTSKASYGDMFFECSSLETIFAGNWEPGDWRTTDVFYGCGKLKGGQGTVRGMNIYGYDEFGNPLYYEVKTGNSWSSVDDSIYAHIDGGKDNPGLFTAK